MATKIVGAATTLPGSQSKNQESSKYAENFDPNQQQQSPFCCSSSSPFVTKSQRSKILNPVGYYSPQNKTRQRKFLVAKKKKKQEEEEGAAGSCKCKGGGANKNNKCVSVAYHNLRKSQEELFKNKHDDYNEGASEAETQSVLEEEKEEELGKGESECGYEVGSLIVKRGRERLMEEASPQSGSQKVLHLVKVFEKLLSIPTTKDDEEEKESQEKKNNKMGAGFHLPAPSKTESLESSSTFERTSCEKKQQKDTSQKPFKLRTEQRGKLKEEEFVKKVQEMIAEEEKRRIPIAQGLPWTIDEQECLVKPPVKESTRPIDLKLHSDVRALDRAEFDHQVAENLSLIKQYKLERQRQQKLAEEEEVRMLRKELVPKAQPMPYFDRPFIPRRSMKNPTTPREPKFHIHKKIKCSLSSWNDMSPESSYLN